MTSKNEKEEYIGGVILSADFGYGMKYKDEESLYLKLKIQMFDGYDCIQLFSKEKIGRILLQYKGDSRRGASLKSLRHEIVYLLTSDMTNGIPNAIAKLPPSKYSQYQWVRNDNWD